MQFSEKCITLLQKCITKQTKCSAVFQKCITLFSMGEKILMENLNQNIKTAEIPSEFPITPNSLLDYYSGAQQIIILVKNQISAEKNLHQIEKELDKINCKIFNNKQNLFNFC